MYRIVSTSPRKYVVYRDEQKLRTFKSEAAAFAYVANIQRTGG